MRGRRKAIHSRLMQAQDGKCCYCKVKMTQKVKGRHCKSNATIEHVQRKAEGGTDRIGNLALACYECNQGRGDTDWLTYASYKQGEISL